MAVPTTTPKKESKFSRVPWKPIVAAVGTAGAAHLLGYLTSGAVSKGISKVPGVKGYWNQLTPRNQKALATGMVGLTGTAIPIAVLGQQLASRAHLEDEMEREKSAHVTKTASVIMVYRTALERSRG